MQADSNSILVHSILLYSIVFRSFLILILILFYSVLISILFSSLLPFYSFLSYPIYAILFCSVLVLFLILNSNSIPFGYIQVVHHNDPGLIKFDHRISITCTSVCYKWAKNGCTGESFEHLEMWTRCVVSSSSMSIFTHP